MSEEQEHPALEVIRRRASAEEFDPNRSMTEADVRALVTDATRAPSSFNIQHWRFVAVRAPEDRERLTRAAYNQPQVTRAPVTFIVLGDTLAVDRLPEILQGAVDAGVLPKGKARAWIRMAKEIYNDSELARDEAIRSASLAAMTLMLSAEARGWVSCALTGFDAQAVCREFEIEERYVPVMLLAVGHPSAPHGPRMPRLGVDDVLTFDRGPGGGDRTP
jgi:nitroreductase